MRGIKILIGAVLGLSSLMPLGAQAQCSRQLSTTNLENSLFPAATCNTSQAIPLLRQRLDGKNLQTQWDGDLPWPDVLGVWTRPDRDAYVVVGATDTPSGKWGRVKVTIKSICSDKTLAQGSRIITDSDWGREYLVVNLRNYSLNGSRLSAIVKSPKQPMCTVVTGQQTLEVRVMQEEMGEDGIKISTLRDTFIAERL